MCLASLHFLFTIFDDFYIGYSRLQFLGLCSYHNGKIVDDLFTICLGFGWNFIFADDGGSGDDCNDYEDDNDNDWQVGNC